MKRTGHMTPLEWVGAIIVMACIMGIMLVMCVRAGDAEFRMQQEAQRQFMRDADQDFKQQLEETRREWAERKEADKERQARKEKEVRDEDLRRNHTER